MSHLLKLLEDKLLEHLDLLHLRLNRLNFILLLSSFQKLIFYHLQVLSLLLLQVLLRTHRLRIHDFYFCYLLVFPLLSLLPLLSLQLLLLALLALMGLPLRALARLITVLHPHLGKG